MKSAEAFFDKKANYNRRIAFLSMKIPILSTGNSKGCLASDGDGDTLVDMRANNGMISRPYSQACVGSNWYQMLPCDTAKSCWTPEVYSIYTGVHSTLTLLKK
jgi:hypothetical protein